MDEPEAGAVVRSGATTDVGPRAIAGSAAGPTESRLRSVLERRSEWIEVILGLGAVALLFVVLESCRAISPITCGSS